MTESTGPKEGRSAAFCRRPHILVPAAALVVLLPSAAHANVATALTYASLFHLLFGNLLIGIFEGLLIGWVFRAPRLRAVCLMVAANYVSSFAGVYLGNLVFGGTGRPALRYSSVYSIRTMIPLAMALSFVVTIALEWPAVVLALKKGERRLPRAFKANLLAQTVSYALLVLYYFSASSLSFYTNTTVDRSLSFVRNPDAYVYYISVDDGDVYRMKLSGSEPEWIADLGATGRFDRLYVLQIEGELELDLRSTAGIDTPNGLRWLLQEDFARTDFPLDRYGMTHVGRPSGWGTDYRPPSERNWEFWAEGRGGGGFNSNTTEGELQGKRFEFSVPFFRWDVTNMSVLPGDELVFQIHDEIIVMDFHNRTMGVLTRGRGPVVVPAGALVDTGEEEESEKTEDSEDDEE